MPPIYDKSTRDLMRDDMVNALKITSGQVFSREQVLAWFSDHYPKIKEGTIGCHLLRLSTNAPSRRHYNAKPREDDVFFQIDGSHFRLYESGKDPKPISKTDPPEPNPVPGSEPTEQPQSPGEFAYESDLRDFLAKNLNLLEPGLSLYQDEGINGIEFPAGGRFIDILAVDAKNALVVIELKVSRGYDRVVGQLLRYMGWIEKHLADSSQTVRGVIVARAISSDLKLACSRVVGVQLHEYKLSVSLDKVSG